MGTGYAGDEDAPRRPARETYEHRCTPLASEGLLGRSVTNLLARHERPKGATGWVVAAYISRHGPRDSVEFLVEREDGRLEAWPIDNGYQLGPSRKSGL